jgi:hypothetical protein
MNPPHASTIAAKSSSGSQEQNRENEPRGFVVNKLNTSDGVLIQRSALGTEATYRIVGENDRGVEVEVVEAPGLEPNTRFTFTTADVIQMTDRKGVRADGARRPKRAVRVGVAKRRYA